MLIARSRSRGFTIIELMIGLTLLGVLLMLAMPSFSTMIQNQKLRATADTVLAGLQTARLEALKRNQTVEFLLTADAIDPGNYDTFAANTSGPAWAVRVDTAACTSGPVECYVDGKSRLEGTNQSDPTALNVQIAATSMPGTNTIRFDPMGRSNVTAANGAWFDITNPAGGTCKAVGGTMRCLRIVVSGSGRVRLCDPAVAPAPGETRAC